MREKLNLNILISDLDRYLSHHSLGRLHDIYSKELASLAHLPGIRIGVLYIGVKYPSEMTDKAADNYLRNVWCSCLLRIRDIIFATMDSLKKFFKTISLFSNKGGWSEYVAILSIPRSHSIQSVTKYPMAMREITRWKSDKAELFRIDM